MRLVAVMLLLAATAACGHAQQQDTTRTYGYGVPWPEASVDTAESTILNEMTVEFGHQVTNVRAEFLADSLAQELQAALRRTDAPTYTAYTFRWPPELQIDREDVIESLKARSEFAIVRPGILVRGAEGSN